MRKRAEMLEGNVRIDSEQAAATGVGDESTLRQVAPAA
jgi:hypothetical protein